MEKNNTNLILASASARRKQLLSEAGYQFKVVISQVDESKFSTEGISPIEYAKKLALAKAADIAKRYMNSTVIGADTIVDFDGQIIGKPRNAAEAKKIIRMLFSKPHKVITALAIIHKSRNIEKVDADITVVHPKKMSETQIAEHISSGIWKDKAGAYAIQENDQFVDHIEGSFTNVMGMPMELLEKMIGKPQHKII